MQSKINWLPLTTLIIFSGVLGYATLTKGQSWGDDFASYIMQAQSVVEGNPNKFVEENGFTIVNSSQLLGPVAYPWGMPVLLAPLYRVFGPNMLALKSLNVVLYVLFLASIAFFLSDRHSDIFLLLFISFFALNPTMLSSLNAVLSDIPFLFFSTTTVFFIGRVVIERRPLISDLADHLLLGILFAVSFFIRTNGVLLILTAVGVQCVKILQLALVDKTANRNMVSLINSFLLSVTKFDWRTVSIRVSPYATFVGLTLIWYRIFPQSEVSRLSYFTSLSLGMLYQHVMYYFELPRTFFYAASYSYIIYGATFPFLLAGMVKSAYRDYHILLYAFFTVLLYLFYPFTGGLRLFFPLLPFYIHFVFLGINWYCKAFEGVWTRIVQGLVVCLLAVVALYFLRFSTQNAFANILVHRNVSSGPFAETSHDMFSFIRENTPEDSVVVFFKPRAMRMLTNRRSVQVDNPHNLTLGSHLCIELGNDAGNLQLSDGTVQQLLEDQKLHLIYQNSDFRLYRILNLYDNSMRPGGHTVTSGG